VVGTVAFLVATIGTNLLHFRAGQGPLISNVIATIAGTFVAFFGNRYWTFRHREGSTMAREYAVFLRAECDRLGIQLVCIGFTYYLLDMHGKLAYNVALLFGIGLGTLFRFWSYRRWVWLAPPVAEAGAMESAASPRRPDPRWPPVQQPGPPRLPGTGTGTRRTCATRTGTRGKVDRPGQSGGSDVPLVLRTRVAH